MIEYVLDMMGWMCNVVDWDDIVDLFDDVGQEELVVFFFYLCEVVSCIMD